jgi:hypothetical protein
MPDLVEPTARYHRSETLSKSKSKENLNASERTTDLEQPADVI